MECNWGPSRRSSSLWAFASWSRSSLPRAVRVTYTWRRSSLPATRMINFWAASRSTSPTALWWAICSCSASSPMVAESRPGNPLMVGVRLVLYPLSAFRAMSQIATRVYETIRTEGTQKEVVSKMQTRAELYDVLNYYSFEDKLDQLFSNDKKS
jgi:hypothetical protein